MPLTVEPQASKGLPAVDQVLSLWGALVLRAVGIVALLCVELYALIQSYRPVSLPAADSAPGWMAVNQILKDTAVTVVSIPTAVAFLILGGVRLRAIASEWREANQDYRWLPWLLANLALFSATSWGANSLSASLPNAVAPPWGAFALWFVGVAALPAALGLALAPAQFWVRFVQSNFLTILLTITAGALVSWITSASQFLWSELAAWTLQASAAILRLYEQSVSVDVAAHTISVGDFAVFVARECSGIEGIGLVTGFLGVFVWAFRKDCRFPNVLLIFPIGIAAIWCLNALRIAVLVSIGAHISPTLAVEGFHSQAGWLSFLLVTITLMFVTYRIDFFRAGTRAAPRAPDPGVSLAAAYLLPFVAIMGASIIAKALTTHGQPFYALSVAAACIAMWPFRDVYLKLVSRPQIVSVVAGLAVGVGWIATDPGRGVDTELGQWLGTLTPALAAAWICVRVIGTTVLVPIAEELAFRGYLHRALIGRRFEAIEPSRFTWLALIISTAAFAVLHQRWLAAAIAGAVYALVMYRTNRVSDAIVAHMASNAIIAAWAIAFGQWSLL